MSLVAGTRLGPYEIQSAIGAGGMGEVYKARDIRLDRTVAIKVLPPDVSVDPDRRARFEREARTVAGLNHAHICTLYDVGDHDGAMFLVMEHLAGQTLADRLEKGPLPMEQVLTVATEIADALSAAHRQGVIHRDVKPANVMLTKAGAKLLDFGLAKLTGHGEQPAAAYAVSAVPTQAATLTGQGVIVGTLQYMAPEQLEGKPPDARTDLWALGAILYEMLTGKRAFEGTSAVSVMSAIMEREPAPIASLQPLTPLALDRLARRCLQKDPDRRWQTAADLADELRWIAQAQPVSSNGSRLMRRPAALWSWLAVGLAAGSLLGALVGFVLVTPRANSRAEVVRSTIRVSPADALRDRVGGDRLVRTAIALSPDGRVLVFTGLRDGRQELYSRPLDVLEAAPIPGTVGGVAPFFSPDGKWVGFWAEGEIRKVPVAGGLSVPICASPLPFGASWGSDDFIVMAGEGGGLVRVPATGGKPVPLTTPDRTHGEVSHRLPHVLPGAEAVLFTVTRSRSPRWGDTGVAVYSRRTGRTSLLFNGGADARYVSSGHLAYVREGNLIAVPFDPARLSITGGRVGIVENVMQAAYERASPYDSGAAQFTVSDTGTLAYVLGGVVPDPDGWLVQVDRTGREERLPVAPRPYMQPRVSPDGKAIVVATFGRNRDIWLCSVAGGCTPLTKEGVSGSPIWDATGRRIVFRSGIAGFDNLYWLPPDGSRGAERFSAAPNHQVPVSVAPGGEVLMFDLGADLARTDSWPLAVVRPDGREESLGLPEDANSADLSPDGQWLAYSTRVSDRNEVFVQPYGRPGAKYPVSTGGGLSPCWRRDGREIFYVVPPTSATDPTMTVMAVPVSVTDKGFSSGKPRMVFSNRPYVVMRPARNYDVSPDGHLVFAQIRPSEAVRPAQVTLVQNWFEELKAKVPPAR